MLGVAFAAVGLGGGLLLLPVDDANPSLGALGFVPPQRPLPGKGFAVGMAIIVSGCSNPVKVSVVVAGTGDYWDEHPARPTESGLGAFRGDPAGKRRERSARHLRPARGLPRIVPSEHTSAGSGRSPRPAPPTPAGWSRRPTTTAAAPRSARRSSAASAAKHPRSSTSPGAHNAGSTLAGASSKTPAANQAGSSRSQSPASSPATAGRSPPAPQRRLPPRR